MVKKAVEVSSKVELENGNFGDSDVCRPQDGDASQLAQIGKKAVLKVHLPLQYSHTAFQLVLGADTLKRNFG